MIPTGSKMSARGFVLRTINGLTSPVRMLVTSTGHRVRLGAAPSLGGIALRFAGVLMPLLMAAALILGAMVFLPHAHGPALATLTLASKNRQANELRAQADTIRDEILDTTKPLTVDELKTKQDARNALLARANVIAEFTATDEVRRQGGEGELQRIDSAEATTEHRLTNRERSAMRARIDDFSKRAKDTFGNVNTFLKVAVSGTSPIESPEQRAMVEEARVLTRAIVGTTGDISGGEFLLPLTQVGSIFSLQNVQQGLLQRARAYNVPGRTLRIPYLVQTDENSSTTLNRPMAGNIANVSIVGEGSTKPARQPEFGQRLLTVYKYAAITQVSDELLADDFTGELPSEFVNAVGQQTLNAVNEDITIDGTGTGEPYGALLAGQAYNIAQARDTSGTIKPVDLFGMYAKHTHGPGSVWLASRRTVQALYNMSLTSASLVTFLRNLNETPQMMILGYPVILTDLLPTLGTTGDIGLVNPDFYAFALRQALTVESSRDYAFVQDLTTYRFIVRAGGLTINTGKYAYKYADSAGVDEHSPFVYLSA